MSSGGNLGDPSFEEREEIGDNDDADTVCIYIDVVHKHVFTGYRLYRIWIVVYQYHNVGLGIWALMLWLHILVFYKINY